MSSDHFHLMLWFHFAHFHARICVLCSAAASLNRSVSTVTYWFVSTWCWWRDRGPTSRNRLLGGLLPPPSSICVTLRPPHRTSRSLQRAARKFKPLISNYQTGASPVCVTFAPFSPKLSMGPADWDQPAAPLQPAAMDCCAFGSVRLLLPGYLRIALLCVVQLGAFAQHGEWI